MDDRIYGWILTIGNEIVNGVISDTNRETVSRELQGAGITVKGMSSVGDDVAEIADALRSAMEKASLVVVSGGLGPTEDDKTAAGAARFLGVGLEEDAEQVERIAERFRQWGRTMSHSNRKQAMFPVGATPIPNDYGTAPGFMIEKAGSIALFFPGIPRELVRMLRERGMPIIVDRFGVSKQIFGTRTLHVYGLSESKLGEILDDVAQDEDGFHLAFLPRFPIIRLRMDAAGPNPEAVAEKLDEKHRIIAERIPENIISDSGQAIEEVVLELLERRGWTLGLAESITGGMIGQMITGVPGSSKTFMGSVVSYSNDMKIRLLGVSEETLAGHGAVSHRCAAEMAHGARSATNTDVAVSVTGIAGPAGGSPEKPVGTFFIGVATPESLLTRRFQLPGERAWVRTLATMQALDTLRRYLLDYRIHGKAEDEE